MNRVLRSLIIPLVAYACMVGANVFVHYVNYQRGLEETQKSCYGPNLTRRWEEFTTDEVARITDLRVLVPLDAIIWKNKMPLIIRNLDSDDRGLKLQFDVPDKKDEEKDKIKGLEDSVQDNIIRI